MDKFLSVTSHAAPLPQADIDTDQILPARFLLLLERKGIGRYLFHDLRSDTNNAPFVLDTPPYERAQIIVAGHGFGTGSSREGAVWALVDFGIRCVISPQFGEIFYANCIRNGVLPIEVGQGDHARFLDAAIAGRRFTVDLENNHIRIEDEAVIAFAFQENHRKVLLQGLDEIDQIIAGNTADIARFESVQRQSEPWLWLNDAQLAGFRHPG